MYFNTVKGTCLVDITLKIKEYHENYYFTQEQVEAEKSIDDIRMHTGMLT